MAVVVALAAGVLVFLPPAPVEALAPFPHMTGSLVSKPWDWQGTVDSRPSGQAAISPEGEFVAYISEATNLVEDPLAPLPRVYLHDQTNGSNRVIDPDGAVAVDPADPVVAEDGRFIAFTARADRLDPGAGRTVYSVDVTTGVVARVEADPNFVADAPSISDDGGTVVYSAAPRTDPTARQIRAWDRATRTTQVLSRAGGADGDGPSTRPAISGDGTTVVFTTEATNLVAGLGPGDHRQDGGATEVVALDRRTGTITLVSSLHGMVAPATAGDSWVDGPGAVSTDGRWVAYTTGADTTGFDAALTGDLNGSTDVVVRDRTAGTARVVSATSGSTCAGASTQGAVDDEGSAVFASTCTNLVPDTVGTGTAVYGAEAGEAPIVVSHAAETTTPALDPETGIARPSLSRTGQHVALTSSLSLGPSWSFEDDNGLPDAYLFSVGDMGSDPEPEVVDVPDLAGACPSPTRSVVADFPPDSEWPTDDWPHVELLDDSMGVALRFDYRGDGFSTGPALDDEGNGLPTREARAVVVELVGVDGSRQVLRWDHGVRLFEESGGDLPTSMQPARVAVCIPATADLGPRAFPDATTVLAGTTVEVDVLANDEGDLDLRTLALGTVSAGSATVVTRDGRPLVAFTAPDDETVATVTYTVADHSGSLTSGLLTVQVGQVATQPLDLALDVAGIWPDEDTGGGLFAANRTGAPVVGGVVTFATRAPATVVGASGSGWSCTVAGDARSVTCSSGDEVADGASFPGIGVQVRTPAGPQPACDPADPSGDACVPVRAWNGPADGEAAADPAPVHDRFTYLGGVLRASVDVDGPFTTGSLGTYRLTTVNAGQAPLPAGTLLEVRSAHADMAFAGGSSPGWTCTVDPDDPTRATCASQAVMDPLVVVDLPVLYVVGAGQSAGCPGTPPCVTLDVSWVDTPAAALRVPIASHTTSVEEAANPTPPDLTIQLTHRSVVWTGFDTTFRAVVTNAGLGPTTDPVTVSVELPAGLTPNAVAAPGWSCTVGTPTTCERSDPMAAGAIAPTISLTAFVEPGATDGTATAAVATNGDPVPTNNTSNDYVSVRNGDPEAPDGPTRIGVEVEVPDRISPGETVGVTVALANHGGTDATGPQSVGVIVPDGIPVGQVLDAVQRDPGVGPWACVATPLAGVRELRCTHPGPVGAGTTTPLLDLEVTATSATPGSTVDLVVTHLVDGSPVTLVRRMAVVPPRITRLAMSTSQPLPVRPGGTALLHLAGRNVGTAAPTDELHTRLTLPAGIVAEAIEGNGWTCTGLETNQPSCTNPELPLPGTGVPPMVVTMRAGPDVDAGRYDAGFRIATTDPMGEVVTEGIAVVSVATPTAGDLGVTRPDLPRATTEDRTLAYDLVVANAGTTPVEGTLEVRENFPTGTTVSGSGDGWSCAPSGTALLCERPGTDLGEMEEAPPIRVEASFPERLAGGQVQLTATATMGWATGLGADAVVVTRVEVPRPELTFSISGNPATLLREATGTAVVRVGNQGSADATDPLVVGVVLSRGLVPTAVTGSGWTCVHDGAATQASVACLRTEGPAVGAHLPAIEVSFDVSSGAPDQGVLSAGRVGVASGSDPGPVLDRLRGQGTAALETPVADVRPVRGLVAEAGPDQTVAERVVPGDGTSTATVVQLDGRGSSAGAAPLTWEWVQTAGPAVDWLGPVGTATAADGTERPSASGATPRFAVPRLVDDEDVQLAFELTAGSGDARRSDTVTVTVTPTSDLGPVLGRISTDLPQIVAAPAEGTTVVLGTTADDPEGDAVSVSWTIATTDGSAAATTIATGSNLVTTPGGSSSATFDWPTDATYVVVEATGTSARGAATVTSLAIGTAPPPPAISVTGPGRVASGAPATATANVDIGDASSLIWRWRQTSGPALDPAVLNAATGPELTFTAPSVSTDGQVVELTVVATRVAGASSVAAPAGIAIAVDRLPAPAVAISGAAAVGVDAPVTLAVTGAPPGSTVAWIQRSGPAGGFGSPTGTTTTFQAVSDGVAAVEARVTDPTGRVSSATHEVTVGNPVRPSGATACTAAGSLLNSAFAAAGEGRGLAATLGPVSVDLGSIQVEAPCGGASPSLTFLNAGFSIAGGTVTGSGMAGRITQDRLCITGGNLAFPSSWGLTAAQLGTTNPICVTLGAGTGQVSGSFTVTGIPLLKLPAGVTAPVTTVTFTGAVVTVRASAGLPGGGTLTVDLAVNATTGTVAGTASGRLVVLGTAVDLDGAIAYDGTTFTFTLDGSVPGPVTLVPGTTIANVVVSLDRDGVRVGGEVTVGGQVALRATGSFSGADTWSLGLTGTAGQGGWEPLPGLTVGPVGFSGKVERAGGPVSFEVQVDVPGEWAPVDGLRATGVRATLANVGAPAECPAITPGNAWLAVTGLGELRLGEVAIDLSIQACVGIGQRAWSVGTTATLDAWAPIPGLDVSVESVGVRGRSNGDGTGMELSAFGFARAFGASLGAVATYRSGSLVIDASGDLSQFAVPLPEGASGHAIFASNPRANYSFQRPGAVPSIDPNLAAMNIPQGISLYAAMDLPDDLRAFITQRLGLPDVSSVVVSVQLGGADLALEATMNFGDPATGIVLYEDCSGASCTPQNRTALSMRQLVLRISTSDFGFRAAGRLELAATDQTAPSSIDLRAMMTIGFSPPSITAAFELDGTWHGALGTPGLDLSWFAIQGGVVFGTGIPTPSFGVGATVDRLPDSWASTLGMPASDQEPITFAINLSAATPIFEIQIGEADGDVAIDPLASLGAPGVLEIDYASLVISPNGGMIGSKLYPRGVSLGFAAQIAGVELDAAFSVNFPTLRIQGDVNLGAITVGGVQIHGATASFDINPLSATPFSFAAEGSARFDTFAGSGAFSASMAITIGLTGLHAQIGLRAEDVSFGGIVTIQHFDLEAGVAVAVDRLPDVTFQLDARGDILGTDVGLAGAFEVSGGKVRNLAAAAVLDVDLGAASLSGPGCSGYAQLGQGACLQFALQNQTITAAVDARLTVAGASLHLTGSIDRVAIRASATLELPGLGDFAVSGALYTGAGLGGYQERDFEGNLHQVSQGDFRFAAGYTTSSFGGFSGSAAAVVARVGPSIGVGADLWVSVPGGYATGSARFGVVNGQLTYDLAATGNLNLAGVRLDPASVRLVKTPTAFSASVAATLRLSVPGVAANASVAGSFTAPSANAAATYSLSGNVAVNMAGLQVSAALALTPSRFSFSAYLGTASVFQVTVQGTFTATMVSASASASVLGTLVTISARVRSGSWHVGASLSYRGYTFADVSVGPGSFTASVGFSIHGSGSFSLVAVRFGGTVSVAMNFGVTISRSGGSLGISGHFFGSGSATGWIQHWECDTSGIACAWPGNWRWSRQKSLGGFGVSINSSTGRACAVIRGESLCVDV